MAEEIIVEKKEQSKFKELAHKVYESKWFQLGCGALLGIASWEGGKRLVASLASDQAEDPSIDGSEEAELPF